MNFGKTMFSESFPELWLYLMGALFIGVVMYFPSGLAGIWKKHGGKVTGFINKLQLVKNVKSMIENNRTNKLSAKNATGE